MTASLLIWSWARDILSTLFAFYVNYLSQETKQAKLGLDIEDLSFIILLYGFDMLLVAENNNLQRMLNGMSSWYSKWRLVIVKRMHFHVQQSDHLFLLWSTLLLFTTSYWFCFYLKYVLLWMKESTSRVSGKGVGVGN